MQPDRNLYHTKHTPQPYITWRACFGKGEYRYFKYPLPDLIAGMRTALYPRLAGVANEWNERMGLEQRYPASIAPSSTMPRSGPGPADALLLQYIPATSTACIDLYAI